MLVSVELAPKNVTLRTTRVGMAFTRVWQVFIGCNSSEIIAIIETTE